jgi:hypothetical protein
MAVDIRDIVRQGAEREREIVQAAGLTNEGEDEVAGADIVREVAELLAAVRVITEVLDDGTAIRVAVRLFELLGCGVRIPREQRRFQFDVP